MPGPGAVRLLVKRSPHLFPERRRHGQGLSNRWGMSTREAHDLGTVHITFEGDSVVASRFKHGWPTARFLPGRHFMDERFQLPVVDGGEGRRVQIPRTVRASDGLQHAVPFWHRYFGSISAELECILEGRFTVAKNGLPVRPIIPAKSPVLGG